MTRRIHSSFPCLLTCLCSICRNVDLGASAPVHIPITSAGVCIHASGVSGVSAVAALLLLLERSLLMQYSK